MSIDTFVDLLIARQDIKYTAAFIQQDTWYIEHATEPVRLFFTCLYDPACPPSSCYKLLIAEHENKRDYQSLLNKTFFWSGVTVCITQEFYQKLKEKLGEVKQQHLNKLKEEINKKQEEQIEQWKHHYFS